MCVFRVAIDEGSDVDIIHGGLQESTYTLQVELFIMKIMMN